ncbi:uncharacterized protein E0L32_005986 [Thyridium curvatum]|uniref:Uncharacterized protein n=1 Tax=Thyridium curvatum TaxID=1093900 RepID=A0A507ART8_9PEZI|nr:uncharacterized protein E0L32_005986 [Thyridium curvatum]TPX13515.1 hypothetical protein E0L32_005986 [Thyridium curvatum]
MVRSPAFASLLVAGLLAAQAAAAPPPSADKEELRSHTLPIIMPDPRPTVAPVDEEPLPPIVVSGGGDPVLSPNPAPLTTEDIPLDDEARKANEVGKSGETRKGDNVLQKFAKKLKKIFHRGPPPPPPTPEPWYQEQLLAAKFGTTQTGILPLETDISDALQARDLDHRDHAIAANAAAPTAAGFRHEEEFPFHPSFSRKTLYKLETLSITGSLHKPTEEAKPDPDKKKKKEKKEDKKKKNDDDKHVTDLLNAIDKMHTTTTTTKTTTKTKTMTTAKPKKHKAAGVIVEDIPDWKTYLAGPGPVVAQAPTPTVESTVTLLKTRIKFTTRTSVRTRTLFQTVWKQFTVTGFVTAQPTQPADATSSA